LALLVGLDRQERGLESEFSATQELEKSGIETFSIVSLRDIRHYIANELTDTDLLKRMDGYRDQYGVKL
jgi:orotate phosphoribosyltransferase